MDADELSLNALIASHNNGPEMAEGPPRHVGDWYNGKALAWRLAAKVDASVNLKAVEEADSTLDIHKAERAASTVQVTFALAPRQPLLFALPSTFASIRHRESNPPIALTTRN
jgi:hypothetical protein